MSARAVKYKTADLGEVKMFYREAGDPSAPAVLLLHGFPTSSHMYRNLIPLLADKYRVIAPDFPGFGSTKAPRRGAYAYTFGNLYKAVQSFVDTLNLERFAMMVFDYGAPVGFRLAAAYPNRTPPSSPRTAMPTRWGCGKTLWRLCGLIGSTPPPQTATRCVRT